MHVDFKIEAWERVSIPEAKVQEVAKALESGKVSTANDLIELLEELGDSGTYEGMIAETETQMLPEENDGQATIELILEKGSSADWTNAKKQ